MLQTAAIKPFICLIFKLREFLRVLKNKFLELEKMGKIGSGVPLDRAIFLDIPMILML